MQNYKSIISPATLEALERLKGFGYSVNMENKSWGTYAEITSKTSEYGYYFFDPAKEPARAGEIRLANDEMEAGIARILRYEQRTAER